MVKQHVDVGDVDKKTCTKCGSTKDNSLFYSNKGKKHPWCKQCFSTLNDTIRYQKYSSIESRVALMIKNAKLSSLKRNNEFAIDANFIISLWYAQNQKCYYTQWKMSLRPNCYTSVSIERINSEIGYTKKNTVLCCTSVNSMKSHYPKSLFIKVCKAVTQAEGIKRPSKA